MNGYVKFSIPSRVPNPGLCRIYIGIPASKTSINAADFEITDAGAASLQGGFHYGKTLRSVPYVPPRPLMNHGPHRCRFIRGDPWGRV